MTAGEFLNSATGKLEQAGIGTARLDILVLLEDVLGLDRAAILAHPERKITPAKIARLNKLVTQRCSHLPLAYIRGRASFFGREFVVNSHVLVPRPETETMLEMLLKLPLPTHPKIADIGTGCGCIGITAALEIPDSKVELYDIDKDALKVAAKNAKAFGAQTKPILCDLLDKKPEADVIVANLPYVPDKYKVNQAAENEPKHAIFGGKDGLDLYRRFWEQAAGLSKKPKFVLTESLPTQHQDLEAIANDAGYKLREAQDFIQVFRKMDIDLVSLA